jgi:hypothetical protein
LVLVSLLLLSVLSFRVASLKGAQTDDVLTLETPSQDAEIHSVSADLNYGSDYRLTAGFDNSSQTVYRFLVRFDLPPTPSGEMISSATLKLWGPTPWSGGFPSGETLRACRVTHDWVEGTGKSGAPTQDGATWNEYNYGDDLTTATNNWAAPGGDYTLQDSATVIIPSYPVTWSSLNLTVTNIVKSWTTGETQNFGFLIKLENESGDYKGGVFDSREYGQEYGDYSVPKLEITYTAIATPTPTPTSTPTSTPLPTQTPTTTPTPTMTPTSSPSASATPSPERTTEGSALTPEIFYAVAAAVGIIAVASFASVLARKQKKQQKAP